MIALKRAALAAALAGFAVLLAGCLDNEPAQRRAFIEFLQTRIIDRPGLHIPIMSDQDVANFGPYADHYRIMNGFHHRLDAAISADMARAMQIANPRSLEQVMSHRDVLPVIEKDIGKMKIALDVAQAEADAAHAKLQQPPDLKAVYDKAYERMVTRPARVFREIIPILLSSMPVMEKITAFLDAHRNAIEYRGGLPVTRDPALRPQLNALMQEGAKIGEASILGKQKMRALMEDK